MKKFLLILAILLLMPVKGFCENVVPQYVSIEHTNTLGLYQAPSEIVLYKEPYQSSNIVHSISWIGDKIFPESVKANDLFIVFLPQKNLGFLAVTDETDEWVQVIYNNSTGDKGWIKKDDPYRFMSWIMFYNMYGKKYGLNLLKEAPPEAKDLHTSTDDKSQIVGTINMPQKINLNVMRGNWALVSVMDIDRTPKTGYVRWRSDNGVKYYFPAIK
ncbi:unknown [Clostridium sp. CAG:768]|nr:unknown [Clostridium sp. CAG:768]